MVPKNMATFIFVIMFMFLLHGIKSNKNSEEFDGNCFCAMFRIEDDPAEDEPLLISDPQIPIPHNINGARSCLRICVALFAASKDNAARALCQVTKRDTKNLRVAVYFRLCDEERWASTRNANRSPICCKDETVVECEE